MGAGARAGGVRGAPWFWFMCPGGQTLCPLRQEQRKGQQSCGGTLPQVQTDSVLGVCAPYRTCQVGSWTDRSLELLDMDRLETAHAVTNIYGVLGPVLGTGSLLFIVMGNLCPFK